MNGSAQSAPEAAPSALDEALDLYLAHLRVERGLLPATLESYARDLREYLDWLQAHQLLRLAEVAQAHVLEHIGSLQQRGLSRSSQARHLAALRGLHRFAVAEDLSGRDPSVGVEASRGSRPLPNRFLQSGVNLGDLVFGSSGGSARPMAAITADAAAPRDTGGMAGQLNGFRQRKGASPARRNRWARVRLPSPLSCPAMPRKIHRASARSLRSWRPTRMKGCSARASTG